MIESQYSSVITSTGHAANIQAKALEIPIVFDAIAFGSGGLIPNESATGLVKEEVRVKVNSVLQNQTDANVLEIEAVIPANTGGFTINEAAIYLDDGTLYAVASLPESYKPILEQGAGKEFLFVFFLTSVGAENVTLTIDGGASFITINFFQNELKKYALINGDETEKFKVADAQNDNEAINKKQLNALESRLKSSSNRNIITATKVVGAGYMGEFGQGLWNAFYRSGTFTVPNDVDKIRVRVVGGGGGAKAGITADGGGGGGYAHGVFDVIPGVSYFVSVGGRGAGGGESGIPTAGGTSSFGSLISATGGGAGRSGGGTGTGTGGVGFVGDDVVGGFKANGGSGNGKGGAGAGSQLGNGGHSLSAGGAGVCFGNSLSLGGGSAFGVSIDTNGAPSISGDFVVKQNPIGATIRFPFDCFTGAGGNGGGAGGNGGGGGASATGGGAGGNGGGGGASTGTGTGGNGGIGGGGGASASSSPGGIGGNGGSGIVVVEW